jgi:hypothetical protein
MNKNPHGCADTIEDLESRVGALENNSSGSLGPTQPNVIWLGIFKIGLPFGHGSVSEVALWTDSALSEYEAIR